MELRTSKCDHWVCSFCAKGNGGCFPLHCDSDEQVDGRRVTAIFSLNTDWQPSHGGQLQLFPFPDDPVAIAPIADRLVLFSSCRMLHRSSKPPSASCFCPHHSSEVLYLQHSVHSTCSGMCIASKRQDVLPARLHPLFFLMQICDKKWHILKEKSNDCNPLKRCLKPKLVIRVITALKRHFRVKLPACFCSCHWVT